MNELFSTTTYTLLPSICGFMVIILGYLKLWELRRTEHPETIAIYSICLIGIIGLLLGIFGQVWCMMDIYDGIDTTGDISPSIIAQEIKGCYKSTLIGLAVLIISLIVWGILKGTKYKKILLTKTEED